MAKKLALVIGIILLLVGAAGLFPNSFVGIGSTFEANFAHNLIHLVLGLILVWVAEKATSKSAMTLKVIGVIAVIIALLGFFMGSPILGFITSNAASDWLHLVVGLLAIIAGVSSKRG